jgi:hypothetical protein
MLSAFNQFASMHVTNALQALALHRAHITSTP